MGHIAITANSDAELCARLGQLLQHLPGADAGCGSDIDLYAPEAPWPGSGLSNKQPLVGIIMGLDSGPVPDPTQTGNCLSALNTGQIGGIRAILGGASASGDNSAAYLPGMVAAMTALPVIDVPVKWSSLDGVDLMHSIVQMHRGMPVANGVD